MDERLKLIPIKIESPYGVKDQKLMESVLEYMRLFNHSLAGLSACAGISKPTIKTFFSGKTRTDTTRTALSTYVNKFERLIRLRAQMEEFDEAMKNI